MPDNLIGGKIDEEVAILGAAVHHLMGFEIRKLDLVFAGAPQWELTSYQTLLLPFHGTIRHGSLVDIPGPETNLQLSCGCEEGKKIQKFHRWSAEVEKVK